MFFDNKGCVRLYNEGMCKFKYVARNQHLEEELKYILELNWILCKGKRERHAQLRLEVSHTGLQNLPEGHQSFWQIFSFIGDIAMFADRGILKENSC